METQALREKLINGLRDQLPDLQEDVFITRDGERLIGYVASDRFADLDHWEQLEVFDALVDEVLTKEEQERLGPITTMTLEDVSYKLADAEYD